MISLIVDGVDTYKDLGLYMEVEEIVPPSPKFYTVDIPGGNGKINLTKALTGDAVYDNRSFTLKFTAETPADNFAEMITKLTNLWNGKEFDFKLSFDPLYTYHGWFTVSAYKKSGNLKQITLEIDADPYKYLKTFTDMFNVSVGFTAHLSSGRKMVRPTFEFSGDTIVIFEGNRFVMPKGTYTINEVWFKEGVNEISFIDADAPSYLTWGELERFTWGDVKSEKPIYEWYKGIKKDFISYITLESNGSPITGDVVFTAEDDTGATIERTLPLGDLFIYEQGEVKDKVFIYDDYAHVQKWIVDDGSGVYSVLPLPQSYAIPFAQIFSNDGEIVSLTHNSSGVVSYEKKRVNVTQEFINATYGNYSENGEIAMTNEQMSSYTYAQLRNISNGYTAVDDNPTESVFVQYDWSDL